MPACSRQSTTSYKYLFQNVGPPHVYTVNMAVWSDRVYLIHLFAAASPDVIRH